MTKSAKEVVQEEEDEEKKAMEEKIREEEELKKEKERQAFLDNIYVMVAVVIIVAGAVGIVFAKIHFFSEEVENNSQSLHQKVIKLFLEIRFRFVRLFSCDFHEFSDLLSFGYIAILSECCCDIGYNFPTKNPI